MNTNRAALICRQDILVLENKEQTYQGSWKKRGGIGAFMMLARKWDRLENMSKNANYDVFAACFEEMSGEDGTPLAEIRDLRRYLLLLEEYILSHHRDGTPKEDSNRHVSDPSNNT